MTDADQAQVDRFWSMANHAISLSPNRSTYEHLRRQYKSARPQADEAEFQSVIEKLALKCKVEAT